MKRARNLTAEIPSATTGGMTRDLTVPWGLPVGLAAKAVAGWIVGRAPVLESAPGLIAVEAEELTKAMGAGIDEIDPKEVSTLHFEDWDPFVVRVGRFGPYVEGEIDGDTATASLPSDIAPDEVTPDYLLRLLKDRQTQGRPLAILPESGKAVLLREGRFGPYLQLGEAEEGSEEKPVTWTGCE